MDDLHLIDPDKKEKIAKTVYYNRAGQMAESDGPDTFAKTVSGILEQFYVKKSNERNTASRLLNPNAPFFQETTEGRNSLRMGKPLYEYRKVSRECFDLYLKFLSTGNASYLRSAERILD